MVDVIAAGAAWFEEQWRAHLTSSVSFRALAAGPNGAWASMPASLGIAETANVSANGALVRVQTRTITVSRADMPTEPRRGDQFRLAENGEIVTYAVCSEPGSERVWEWADRTCRLRQVYTTPVARTPA